jgi:hypothetical protein
VVAGPIALVVSVFVRGVVDVWAGAWDCSVVDRGDTSRGAWDFFVSYTQADRAWAE